MQILTFTTLYPNAERPQHGIFVETRLNKLVESGRVAARILAPSPWFPFASPRFGNYSVMARVPREEVRHGLRIEHPRYPLLPRIGMNTAPLALFAATLPRLRRQIAAGGDFDLIDAHYFYPDGVAGVLLGHALGRPVVVTARGSDLNLIADYAVPRRWIRWAAAHAAGLITVSSGLKDRLVALGTAPERVRVLRNGVDLALFRPWGHERDREAARRSLGFIRPTLLAVGNLVALKRHGRWSRRSHRCPMSILSSSARDPSEARSKRWPVRAGWPAGCGCSAGCRNRTCLKSTAPPICCCWSPPMRAGPTSRLKVACGTPVVVSDIPGIADIVGAPAAGRIVAGVTPDRLGAAIRELLAASPDRAATRVYAEQFSWQSTTDGQIALFQEVCERHSQGQTGHRRSTRA